MPHYADGTEAKVGDQVIAPVFNSGDSKAGVIISITPGAESCNALIQFSEVRAVGEDPPRMAIRKHGSPEQGSGSPADVRTVKTEAHGSSGPEVEVYVCADYCDTNKLTKVGSP